MGLQANWLCCLLLTILLTATGAGSCPSRASYEKVILGTRTTAALLNDQ
jgi:hypothetical protein